MCTNGGDMLGFIAVQCCDNGMAAGFDIYQPVLADALDGFSDRRAADTELLRDFALRDTISALQFSCKNHVLDMVEYLIGYALSDDSVGCGLFHMVPFRFLHGLRWAAGFGSRLPSTRLHTVDR